MYNSKKGVSAATTVIGVATIMVMLGIVTASIILFVTTYTNFEKYILEILQRPQLRKLYEQALPPAKYRWIQWAGLITSISLLLLSVYLFFRTSFFAKIVGLVIALYNKARSSIRYITIFQNRSIGWLSGISFTIITVHVLYWMVHAEISYDEAATYLLFCSKGLLFSVAQYPIPSNHIFFTAIGCFFVHLPLNDLLAFRLALLPGFLGTVLTMAYVGKKYCGERWVVPTVLTIYLSPAVCYYSVIGRGYIYVCLFAALALALALGFLQGHINRRRCLAFAVVVALGLYSVPTYLLFAMPAMFALAMLALLRRQIRQLGLLCTTFVASGLLTLLLYAVPLVVSGPGQTLQLANAYSLPEDRYNILLAAMKIGTSIQDWVAIGVWAIALLVLLGSIFARQSRVAVLFFSSVLLFLFVYILVLHKFSLSTNWVHVGVVLPFAIAYLLVRWHSHLQKTVWVAYWCLFFCVAVTSQWKNIYTNELSKQVRLTSDVIFPLKPQTVFFETENIKSILEFFGKTKYNYTPTFFTNIGYFSYTAPFDSTVRYQVVILNKKSRVQLPLGYRLHNANPYYNLYLLNDSLNRPLR